MIKEHLDFNWKSNGIKCLVDDSKIWLKNDVARCWIGDLDSQWKDRLEHSKKSIVFFRNNV